MSLTSALSITRSVNPPRAAFLDYPLGHTAGPPLDRVLQRAILRSALAGFETLQTPGGVIDLGYTWAEDDSWKDAVMRPRARSGDEETFEDDRTPRVNIPQYQTEEDQRLADAALAQGGCPTCIFLE
ncbi:hypothetical protein MK280_13460 [Myxococcota bacterium]|nr:hypothetical protein [Myxococcota bacterium]